MKEFFGDIPTYVYIALFISVTTAIIGALLTHRLHLTRSKRDRFAQECAAFRNAFSKEIDFLKHGPNSSPLTDTTHYVLTAALDKHRKAYERFRIQMGLGRRCFDRAWNQYLYLQHKHYPDPLAEHLRRKDGAAFTTSKREECADPFDDYIYGGDVPEEEIRKLALKRIHRVLWYARAT